MINEYKASKKYFKIMIFLVAIFFIVAILAPSYFSRAENDQDEGGQGDEDSAFSAPLSEGAITPVNTDPIIPATTVEPSDVQASVIPTPLISVNNSALLAKLKDSDHDGVPDISDKHPGEDDFAYSLLDKNNNGVADDLELVLQ